MCILGCLLPSQAEAEGHPALELCETILAYIGCMSTIPFASSTEIDANIEIQFRRMAWADLIIT